MRCPPFRTTCRSGIFRGPALLSSRDINSHGRTVTTTSGKSAPKRPTGQHAYPPILHPSPLPLLPSRKPSFTTTRLSIIVPAPPRHPVTFTPRGKDSSKSHKQASPLRSDRFAKALQDRNGGGDTVFLRRCLVLVLFLLWMQGRIILHNPPGAAEMSALANQQVSSWEHAHQGESAGGCWHARADGP